MMARIRIEYGFMLIFGANDIDEIFSKLRFMIIGCECKWVVVDHLHMLVSALSEGDERRGY